MGTARIVSPSAPYAGDPFAAMLAELRLIRQALEANGGAPLPVKHGDAPWSIVDAAAHLGISERHLRNLVNDGKVQGAKFGRRVMIPAAEVDRLAKAGA